MSNAILETMATNVLFVVGMVFPYVYVLLIQQDAYYCAECTRLEKDRDGCPKTVNIGHARMDAIFTRKMQGM
ncbi:Pre-mRNA-splicing factor ini1 [Malassezia nana]|uniref:Pre-mRNA-splicing factor ini1 n=1 Tax=Malassezia nana TaxID=180528 RepID=A0AAF0J3T4_9BASI|nr:Pre-mRNA-splicing factor ini1 [Malassezia nana]